MTSPTKLGYRRRFRTARKKRDRCEIC